MSPKAKPNSLLNKRAEEIYKAKKEVEDRILAKWENQITAAKQAVDREQAALDAEMIRTVSERKWNGYQPGTLLKEVKQPRFLFGRGKAEATGRTGIVGPWLAGDPCTKHNVPQVGELVLWINKKDGTRSKLFVKENSFEAKDWKK